MKLIRTTGSFPPGGYEFKDPRTGMTFNGHEANFQQQISNIIRHRQGNPKIYPPGEVGFMDRVNIANELSEFNCARLKNDPAYCMDGKIRVAAKDVGDTVGKPCPKCGEPLREKLCSTCLGRRVIGLICLKCDTEVAA